MGGERVYTKPDAGSGTPPLSPSRASPSPTGGRGTKRFHHVDIGPRSAGPTPLRARFPRPPHLRAAGLRLPDSAPRCSPRPGRAPPPPPPARPPARPGGGAAEPCPLRRRHPAAAPRRPDPAEERGAASGESPRRAAGPLPPRCPRGVPVQRRGGRRVARQPYLVRAGQVGERSVRPGKGGLVRSQSLDAVLRCSP